MTKFYYFSFLSFIFLSSITILSCNMRESNLKELKVPDKVIEEGTIAIEQENYEKAHKIILPYAKSGYPEAQFALGLLLGWGYGHNKPNPTETDRSEKMMEWIRLSAINGHLEAINIMADTYEKGQYGLPQNKTLSDCWRSLVEYPDRINECIEIEKKQWTEEFK